MLGSISDDESGSTDMKLDKIQSLMSGYGNRDISLRCEFGRYRGIADFGKRPLSRFMGSRPSAERLHL